MKVSDVMKAATLWVEPSTLLDEIAKKMREEGVGSLPVGENDRLVGMVTDRDIIVRAVAEDRAPSTLSARDVMSEDVVWCYEEMDINDAAEHLQANGVRRVPVVNRDKRFVGMLSVGDITAASGELAGETLRKLSAVGD